MKNLKILVKVSREEGRLEWVHFCYLTPTTLALVTQLKRPAHCWVAEWAEKDFGVALNTWADLELLRSCIRLQYRHRYPELFTDDTIDRQGWFRIWYSEKIKEECENARKEN